MVEFSDYIDCPSCSTIELITAIKSHDIQDTHFGYTLFNEKFSYADVLNGNSDLVTMQFASTPPANISVGGQIIGISPLEISAKKNSKIDVEFIDINHKRLRIDAIT